MLYLRPFDKPTSKRNLGKLYISQLRQSYCQGNFQCMSIRILSLAMILSIGILTVSARGALAASDRALPIGPDLKALGWEMLTFDNIPPTMFIGSEDGVIEVHSDSGSSVLYRLVADDPVKAKTLSWSWKVVNAQPATDLMQTDGDDRVLAVHVVFAEDDFMSRIKGAFHPFARGRVITYVWGDDEKAEFPHPHLPEQGFMMIKRTTDSPVSQWFTEIIDLETDYKRAFGKELPPVAYVAISGDADDLNAMCLGLVKDIRLN